MNRPVKFYQSGTFAIGTGPRPEHEHPERAAARQTHSLHSGHRACPGCGEALAARYAIDAAMRATGNQVIAVNATGCLEAFSTPYPETSWQIPWIHSLFGNAAAVASGVAAALRVKGRGEVRVIAQGGDGGTADIGLGCLSGMFERNDDVLYICYDNEGCMNSGTQRSGTTPPAARTATTVAMGPAAGNPFGTGKHLPLLALTHGIPYVATASVANLRDLEAKVARAMGLRGARYLHVHVPCPPGWGSPPGATIRVARLAIESGLFPLFEGARGEIVATTPIRRAVPVTEYLQLQDRFAHLFAPKRDDARIAELQAIADRNIAQFGLLAAPA